MCERIDQSEHLGFYLRSIGWADATVESQAEASGNIRPREHRPVLHVQDGQRCASDVIWSYRPAWAAAAPKPGKKQISIAINVNAEKVEGVYWKRLLRAGRGIVCASGWFEWTWFEGSKEAWLIHRRDRDPLFIRALANFGEFKASPEEAGFVLVTADSLGGIVDTHDRRPVAADVDHARRWMDPELPAADAAYLARTAILGAEIFEWLPVDARRNRSTDPAE